MYSQERRDVWKVLFQMTVFYEAVYLADTN